MDFKPQIDKLRGTENWTKWKRQIELMLKHHDLFDLVVGDGEDEDEEDQCLVKKDSMAQLILVTSMSDGNVELTATATSAREIWRKLLAVYEQTSGQKVDRLMEEFFKMEKKVDDDIISYVARLQRLFAELNNELQQLTSTKLPELLLMSRIMSTLPQDYFEFKSVWESVSVVDRNLDNLVERLRLIEMR